MERFKNIAEDRAKKRHHRKLRTENAQMREHKCSKWGRSGTIAILKR